jgi:glutathione S-transferase
VRDGKPIRESSVINEYIDAAFTGPSLSPADPLGAASTREFTYQCDEGFSAIVKLMMVKYIYRSLGTAGAMTSSLGKLSGDPRNFTKTSMAVPFVGR